jgi:1-acyl-sn-glycerol-3-phosphate acyltransferase
MTYLQPLTLPLSIFTTTYKHLQKAEQNIDKLDELKVSWADDVLSKLNFKVKVIGEVCEQKPLLLAGNHISYMDIVLLFKTVRSLSFVAKNELSYWPIFGNGAKKLDTIFVKRNSSQSRDAARNSIQEALLKNKRIAIFPSGTTTLNESKCWRKGVFEISKQSHVPIQPFRITYCPLRPVAYIDKDFFPLHLYNLAKHDTVYAQIEFAPIIHVQDPMLASQFWQKWSQEAHHVHQM